MDSSVADVANWRCVGTDELSRMLGSNQIQVCIIHSLKFLECVSVCSCITFHEKFHEKEIIKSAIVIKDWHIYERLIISLLDLCRLCMT
jgi:hypothetical protein